MRKQTEGLRDVSKTALLDREIRDVGRVEPDASVFRRQYTQDGVE